MKVLEAWEIDDESQDKKLEALVEKVKARRRESPPVTYVLEHRRNNGDWKPIYLYRYSLKTILFELQGVNRPDYRVRRVKTEEEICQLLNEPTCIGIFPLYIRNRTSPVYAAFVDALRDQIKFPEER